ncbi:MAG: phosphocholine cytidylyltransferase family protein [Candidatus Krumholzibacteriota bacterium]
MLLAAGQATRLRPLTDNCPKCLLPVGPETILARAIRILASRGLKRFTVVDGFRGDLIREALTTGFPGLDFTFVRNEDFTTTNNAWSLMLACDALAGDEPVFLLDSDIVFEPEVIDRILDGGTANRLGLRTTGGVGDEEMKVRLDPAGRVADLSKEMPPAAAAGESVGLEVFSAPTVTALAGVLDRRMKVENRINEYYEASFVELIQNGSEILPVDLAGLRCMEIDTIEDLDHARREFSGS